jgi:hypothetical protein
MYKPVHWCVQIVAGFCHICMQWSDVIVKRVGLLLCAWDVSGWKLILTEVFHGYPVSSGKWCVCREQPRIFSWYAETFCCLKMNSSEKYCHRGCQVSSHPASELFNSVWSHKCNLKTFILTILLLAIVCCLSYFCTGWYSTGWTAQIQIVAGQDFSLLHSIHTGCGPTQPPIWWVPGTISPGLKWPGREADHSPPSSAKVENGGAVPLFPVVFIA